MQQALLTIPVVAGALFWAGYHYHKDRHLPEPPGNLLMCFLLGVVAAGLSQLFYQGLEPLGLRMDAVELGRNAPLALLAYALLAIGPIEEMAKLLPFLLVVWRFRAFDEPMDGIIYASFLALGYAFVENLQYLAFLSPVEALGRAFAGPVIHILFASLWAHRLTLGRLQGRMTLGAIARALLLAAALHGLYDFLVLWQPITALPLAALMIVALWVWRLRLLRAMRIEAAGMSGEQS